jgi:hypothetical protein
MSEETHPLANLTDDSLQALLRRAFRLTLILGAIASLIVWKATTWRDASMLATGTAISAASILEWRRLIRFLNAKMDRKESGSGAAVSAVLFVFRLMVFGGAIYVSLKCFRGSVVALLSGLGLAVLVMAWEAVRLLRD